jgi:hypothetical protein
MIGILREKPGGCAFFLKCGLKYAEEIDSEKRRKNNKNVLTNTKCADTIYEQNKEG